MSKNENLDSQKKTIGFDTLDYVQKKSRLTELLTTKFRMARSWSICSVGTDLKIEKYLIICH